MLPVTFSVAEKGLIGVIMKPRSRNEIAFDILLFFFFFKAERGIAQAALRRVIRKAIQIRNEIFEVLMNLIAGTFIIPHGFK